jgi:hypothetical protein
VLLGAAVEVATAAVPVAVEAIAVAEACGVPVTVDTAGVLLAVATIGVPDTTAVAVRVAVAATPVPVEVATMAVPVRVEVGVPVAVPGVKVAKGVPQVPVLAVNVIFELVGGWVLHRHCVNPPTPFCTPTEEVAVVFNVPRITSKLGVASYSLISK